MLKSSIMNGLVCFECFEYRGKVKIRVVVKTGCSLAPIRLDYLAESLAQYNEGV